MKYTALYVAMRFFEHTPNIFEKTYNNGTFIRIDSGNQTVFIDGNKAFELDTHESFVKLEFVNRMLTLGYQLDEFSLKANFDFIFGRRFDIIDKHINSCSFFTVLTFSVFFTSFGCFFS